MIERRTGSGFTHDETGSRSMARLLLILTTLHIFHLSYLAVLWHETVPPEVWVIMTTMEMTFAAWAGGARIAQYISQIGQKGLVSLADVIKKRRDPDAGTEATP